MHKSNTFKKVTRFFIMLLLVGIVITLLLKFQSNNLIGAFELEASEQWIVRQERPGEIVARHTQGRREAVQGIKLYRYPDDDIVTVNLISNLTESSYVYSGDPILEIDSISDNSNDKLLDAKVKRLREILKLYYSGEFQAKQNEAVANLALAETNLISYLPIVEKRRELAEKGYLSIDEKQISEDEFFARKQTVEIAKAALEIRKSQIAPGVIAVAKAELEEALQESELAKLRLINNKLITPIEGRVTRASGDPSLLLRVINENALYARIGLPLTFADRINEGDVVKLVFYGNSDFTITSAVEKIVVQSVPMLGQSVLHVLVPVKNRKDEISVSMTGRAIFSSVSVNPFDMMWKRLKYLFGGRNR